MERSYLFLFLFVLVLQISKTLQEYPVAQTQQGSYIGHTQVVDNTTINYWYGIPYAQQPINNLRWKPPQRLIPSNGLYEANAPNVCPQRSHYGIPMTESCLTLNVYAPENASQLPVYVWIHGGSFTTGAGAIYDGGHFLSTSVNFSVPIVIVTINYRLGLLGFLADEDLFNERTGINNTQTTGNYGILDQLMALEWIKSNINGFGGDPSRITIGGESAGGISVTILLTSPLVDNNIYQQAIIESGNIWADAAEPLVDAINATGKTLREATKCTSLECLRSLTVDQLLDVQDVIASKNIFGAAVSPVIDDYVLIDTMENSFSKGNFRKVPVLVGSNTNETSLFTCPFFNGTANVTQVEWFFNTAYNSTIVELIPSIYGSVMDYHDPLSYLNIVFSDSWAHCGARRFTEQLSNYGIPTFLYTYNHIISISPPCLGAPHAGELPMLFPSLLPHFFPNYNLTDSEKQLSTEMILFWASFIRTSNPNYEGASILWNPYHSSTDSDLVIDINSQMRYNYYSSTCSRFWDYYSYQPHT